MKIMICQPIYNQITAQTYYSIMQVLPHYDFNLTIVTGTLIDYARNQIVDIALQKDSDYMLWIDSDIKFTKENLDMAVHSGCDIYTAIYAQRHDNTYTNCLMRKDNFYEVVSIVNSGYNNVDAAGMGFFLIKTDIIKELKKKYKTLFKTVQYEGGGVIGEDVYFCDLLQKEGYGIVADFNNRVGHVGGVV